MNSSDHPQPKDVNAETSFDGNRIEKLVVRFGVVTSVLAMVASAFCIIVFTDVLKPRDLKAVHPQIAVEKKKSQIAENRGLDDQGIWEVISIVMRDGGTWGGVDPETGESTGGAFAVGVAKCFNGEAEREVNFVCYPPLSYESPIQVGDRFRFVNDADSAIHDKSEVIALGTPHEPFHIELVLNK